MLAATISRAARCHNLRFLTCGDSMQGGIKGKEPMGKIVAVSAKGVRIGEDSPRARYTNAEVEQVFMLRLDACHGARAL